MNEKEKLHCWWAYSGQCLEPECRNCYKFLPVLRGQLDRPFFPEFERERMKQCLYDAFVDKSVVIRGNKKRKLRKMYVSRRERECFIKSLKDAIKSLK